jgi:acyl carrier protein
MTPTQARDAIITALASIAPEVDLASVDPDEPLADELDLDSMDMLELRTALLSSTGVEIAADDPAGATLTGLVRAITQRSV